MYAAEGGFIDVVKYLISIDADVFAVDDVSIYVYCY